MPPGPRSFPVLPDSTLTLEFIIGFENEFGFGKKYLGFNRVRSLYNLTLTRGQAPQTPRTFPVLPNSNPNP